MSALDNIDVINGVHLIAPGSAGVTLETGLVGNALQTTQRVSIITSELTSLALPTIPNPQFAITGWLKPFANAVAIYVYYFNGDPTPEIFDFQCTLSFAGANPGRLNVYRNSVSTDESVDIDDVVPVAGSDWFHFVLQQNTDAQFEYSINGSTLVAVGTSLVFPNATKAIFEIESNALGGLFGQTVQYDELAIWPNSLTQAQIFSLYNGGAGQGWPVTI